MWKIETLWSSQKARIVQTPLCQMPQVRPKWLLMYCSLFLQSHSWQCCNRLDSLMTLHAAMWVIKIRYGYMLLSLPALSPGNKQIETFIDLMSRASDITEITDYILRHRKALGALGSAWNISNMNVEVCLSQTPLLFLFCERTFLMK